MHERTNIRLGAAERTELEAVVANRNSPQKHVWRAKIVLLTAYLRGAPEMNLTSEDCRERPLLLADTPRSYDFEAGKATRK